MVLSSPQLSVRAFHAVIMWHHRPSTHNPTARPKMPSNVRNLVSQSFWLCLTGTTRLQKESEEPGTTPFGTPMQNPVANCRKPPEAPLWHWRWYSRTSRGKAAPATLLHVQQSCQAWGDGTHETSRSGLMESRNLYWKGCRQELCGKGGQHRVQAQMQTQREQTNR